MAISLPLRNKIVGAMGAGALAIATAMLSGHDGLEGRAYLAYRDVVGVLTVCDGHTGADIIPGKRYTDAECDALTRRDLQQIAHELTPHIHVPASETQLAALYSFAYNVGVPTVIRSTLLAKLNAQHYNDACDELHRWVFAGGKRWKGLMNRRDVEHWVCIWSGR